MPPTPRSAYPPGPPRAGVPSATPRGRMILRLGAAALVAWLIIEAVVGRGWLLSAATVLGHAASGWVAVAVAAGLASMAAFGATRRTALLAAGIRVPVPHVVGAAFAAGALHTTVPGGAVLATAYTFRRMRDWGASSVVAGWCLAATGVLATASLTLVAMVGVALGGNDFSVTRLAVGTAAAAMVLVVLAKVVHRPASLLPLAGVVLRWVSRVRSRPADTGQAGLAAAVAGLGVIRVSPARWVACAGWSLANWLLDAVCLWACATAVGAHLPLALLLVTYAAGMVALSVSPLPGGVGVVEAVLTVGLTAGGAPTATAVAAVVLYRLVSVGGVAAVGGSVLVFRRLNRPAVPAAVPETVRPTRSRLGPGR